MRLLAVVITALAGCEVETDAHCTLMEADAGKVVTCQEPAETADGVVLGTITNAITASPIEGAAVALPVAHLQTDGNGGYSGTVPAGSYPITFSAAHFTPMTDHVRVIAGVAITKNVALMPTSEVIVTASAQKNPDGSIDLDAAMENLGTAYDESFLWSQIAGPTASIEHPTSPSTRVTFATSNGSIDCRFRVTVTMNDGRAYCHEVSVWGDTP
jgi:hypothetical protein